MSQHKSYHAFVVLKARRIYLDLIEAPSRKEAMQEARRICRARGYRHWQNKIKLVDNSNYPHDLNKIFAK